MTGQTSKCVTTAVFLNIFIDLRLFFPLAKSNLYAKRKNNGN